ncbi:P-loop containing nucleoside triphosphate hydrolase protein, partial [Lasiosphaeris hirsuta]
VRMETLQTVEWHGDPFRMLQLDGSTKNLIENLVAGFNGTDDGSHQDGSYDDIIKGKGQGLIFLLHGPPGLGKTLTAESVAESTHRSLYRITTGELSTNVAELEKQLSDVFRLGARWGALMLLDEADVLMTQRTVSDLQRNAIVAVFLRLLEYYRGILFLTTNRISDFDEAFHSRIHVTLRFGTLKKEWRVNIWREHVNRASKNNKLAMSYLWTEEMFDVLGEIEINGRNIKNLVRTAYAFA